MVQSTGLRVKTSVKAGLGGGGFYDRNHNQSCL